MECQKATPKSSAATSQKGFSFITSPALKEQCAKAKRRCSARLSIAMKSRSFKKANQLSVKASAPFS